MEGEAGALHRQHQRLLVDRLAGVPYTDRGSYIQIIQFGAEFFGETVLPPGQSEDPTSPHYADQRDLAGWWMFKPMTLK